MSDFKLPWWLDKSNLYEKVDGLPAWRIINNDGVIVAACTSEADGKEFVRRVNCHDKLVRRLSVVRFILNEPIHDKENRRWCKTDITKNEMLLHIRDKIDKLNNIIDQALKEAEVE